MMWWNKSIAYIRRKPSTLQTIKNGGKAYNIAMTVCLIILLIILAIVLLNK